MTNVVMISTHPAPYRDNVLINLSQKKDINLKVVTIYENADTHKEWNYSSQLIQEILPKGKVIGKIGMTQFSVIKYIKKADVVITGNFPGTALIALIYSLVKKKRIVYYSDAVKPGKYKGRIRKIINRFIYNKIQSFWVTGNLSKNYYIGQNINKNRIKLGYYTNDYDQMLKDYLRLKEQRSKNRALLKISENDKVFLFIGKLISIRNIKRLLDAFNCVNLDNSNTKLVIVGDGEEEYIIEHALRNKDIIHIKAVPYAELLKYYCVADVYIHPGWEPYSLAVVQAVLCELPVISSNTVGAAIDYVQNGVNGLLIDESSTETLIQAMKFYINNEIDRQWLHNAQVKVLEHNVNWAVNELFEAINYNN